VALNQKVKKLIHESVSESEDIAGVVKNIREQGFDVLLMLEATIGLNEVETETEEPAESAGDADGPFTQHDLTFLKSLRISISGDDDSTKKLPAPRPSAGEINNSDNPEA
jgi:hypothetical protein